MAGDKQDGYLQAWPRSWTNVYRETAPVYWSEQDLNPRPSDFRCGAPLDHAASLTASSFFTRISKFTSCTKAEVKSVKWKRRALNHRLFDFFGIFKIPEHEMESGLNEILNVNKSLMGVSLLWVFQWFMKSHIWHVYKFNLRPFVVNVITFIITALKCNPWLWCVCLHNLLRVLLRFHKCWSHQSVLLYQTLFWNHSCCSRFPGY